MCVCDSTKHILWFFGIALGLSQSVYANEPACTLGLGTGRVEISTSVAKPSALETRIAARDDITYSRTVDNVSNAHELSVNCFLGNRIGIRLSHIGGLKFSIKNNLTSPEAILSLPFVNDIHIQPVSVEVLREIEGKATGVFIYYRHAIFPMMSISIEGGVYHVRAKGHWEASLRDKEGTPYFTLLGETEHEREYFPSFALGANWQFTKNLGVTFHYLPVPGKATNMMFATLMFEI